MELGWGLFRVVFLGDTLMSATGTLHSVMTLAKYVRLVTSSRDVDNGSSCGFDLDEYRVNQGNMCALDPSAAAHAIGHDALEMIVGNVKLNLGL